MHFQHVAQLAVLAILGLPQLVEARLESQALAPRSIGGKSVNTYTYSQQACYTEYGKKSVKPVPRSTATKYSVTVGFPIYETVKPTITVTPATSTNTATSTTTFTVLTTAVDKTDTATQTDTVTTTTTITTTSTTQTQLPEVTTTTTVYTTTTVAAPAGFTPVRDDSSLQGRTVARRDSVEPEAGSANVARSSSGTSRIELQNQLLARAKADVYSVAKDKDGKLVNLCNGKKTYPSKVACKKAVEKVAVTTYTVAGKKTVTRSAPTPIATTTTLQSVTSTSTVQPAAATTTVTTTTTSTRSVTTTATTTETLAAATKTETEQAPQFTAYEACEMPRNYVSSVDGLAIQDFRAKTPLGSKDSFSAKECCISCVTDWRCGAWLYKPSQILCQHYGEARPRRCDVGLNVAIFAGGAGPGEGYTVGNGHCGYAKYNAPGDTSGFRN
ncbi:hypothetical protein IE81DRAFT_369194 [Ceraceosorus guamensis]|uniref:Apple domain-containing protein n=1 Tax=Ceraceosorus guamensis TaxID=1522189 RepID=A0A316VNV5_9BASI|nr:hypothetical protein IE81DRAFT_369194 [Ceraceosorus guamensis]PWN39319.1 hypothetical protein IE81DRAFT_369194 [Ceraceosorus guamensis]